MIKIKDLETKRGFTRIKKFSVSGKRKYCRICDA